MKRGMGNFLSEVAGARPEILEKCQTERTKFQSLGTAILITSVMATISMWFALNSVLGVNAFFALLGAIVWGLIILGIDRWLVTSIPPSGGRRLSIALPRVLLALLLGTLISTPIVLRIFQSEINAQIVVIKQDRASSFLEQQDKSKVGQLVTYWTNDVRNLERVINSNGNVTINPSNDPVVKSLTKQRAAEIALEHKYYEQWQCQLYGGAGCTKKGNGPLAQASEKSYHQAGAEVAKLTNAIQRRDKQLSATDTASRKQRLQEAVSALPAAKRHLAEATAEEDALQAKYSQQNLKTNGLLIRLEALNQLAGKSFTINAVRLLLFLLFLVIECLPITVKLLQQPGNYEKVLRHVSEQELRAAKQPNGGGASSRATAGSAQGNAHGANLARDLHDIWQPTTKVVPTAEHVTVTAPAPEQPIQAEDSTHIVNDRLRRIAHGPFTTDPDRRNGGIELNYREDDL